MKFAFDDGEMDLAVYCIADSISQGHAEISEIMYAAAQMEDGSVASFVDEINKLGALVEARGDECVRKGHATSASECFMRASRYYYSLLFWMGTREPAFHRQIDRFRGTFRQAAKLTDPPIEAIHVPFEGKKLAGYFWPAASDGRQRKTIVAIDGEGWCEWTIYNNAVAARKRGYNFMTVDLPGQGNTPDDGMYYRPDYEVPGKAVVDWVLARPDVDPEQLVIIGEGMGGYIAPRIAMHERRLKACVGNTVYEIPKLVSRPGSFGGGKMDWRLGTMRLILWRTGNKAFGDLDDSELIKTLSAPSMQSPILMNHKGNEDAWLLDPRLITCPLLNIVVEKDVTADFFKYQDIMNAVPHPMSRTIVSPTNVGAGIRTNLGNKMVGNQEMLDWLDEVLEQSATNK